MRLCVVVAAPITAPLAADAPNTCAGRTLIILTTGFSRPIQVRTSIVETPVTRSGIALIISRAAVQACTAVTPVSATISKVLRRTAAAGTGRVRIDGRPIARRCATNRSVRIESATATAVTVAILTATGDTEITTGIVRIQSV